MADSRNNQGHADTEDSAAGGGAVMRISMKTTLKVGQYLIRVLRKARSRLLNLISNQPTGSRGAREQSAAEAACGSALLEP